MQKPVLLYCIMRWKWSETGKRIFFKVEICSTSQSAGSFWLDTVPSRVLLSSSVGACPSLNTYWSCRIKKNDLHWVSRSWWKKRRKVSRILRLQFNTLHPEEVSVRGRERRGLRLLYGVQDDFHGDYIFASLWSHLWYHDWRTNWFRETPYSKSSRESTRVGEGDSSVARLQMSDSTRFGHDRDDAGVGLRSLPVIVGTLLYSSRLLRHRITSTQRQLRNRGIINSAREKRRTRFSPFKAVRFTDAGRCA